MPSHDPYHRALDLPASYRFGFYDSLIVVAALEADCSRIYSEDLQDGQRIDTLTVSNAFSNRYS